MIKTLRLIGSSTILQSIDLADGDEVCGNESGVDKTNLSNPSVLKWSTGAGYLTFKRAKNGGSNIKKGIKVAKSPDYLTLATKKAFNHLQHAFTQAPILQYFNLEQHIQIKTDMSGYAIVRILCQLTLIDLGQWHPVAYHSQKMISARIQ